MRKSLQFLLLFCIFAVNTVKAQKDPEPAHIYNCKTMVVTDMVTNETKLLTEQNWSIEITDTLIVIQSPEIDIHIWVPNQWMDTEGYYSFYDGTKYLVKYYYIQNKLNILIKDADIQWTLFLE